MSVEAKAPAPHEAAAHVGHRKKEGSRRAMEWGIGLGAGSYPLVWLAAAAGSLALGAVAVGAWVVGSALAIGGMLTSVLGRRA